jgi:hypothetical protein
MEGKKMDDYDFQITAWGDGPTVTAKINASTIPDTVKLYLVGAIVRQEALGFKQFQCHARGVHDPADANDNATLSSRMGV